VLFTALRIDHACAIFDSWAQKTLGLRKALMGLDFHGFQFLRYVHENFGDFGSTLTLGRQEVHLSPTDKRILKSFDLEYKWLEEILLGYLGSSQVDSLDYSDYECASIIHDLNSPIDNQKKFHTVVDLGTLEHVFDIKTSISNIIKLVENDGLIIHVLPANNYSGHGFYQFSPELFLSLYKEKNGFCDTQVLLAEMNQRSKWYKVLPLKPGERLNLASKNFMIVLVVTRLKERAKNLEVFQSDYESLWKDEVPDFSMKKNQAQLRRKIVSKIRSITPNLFQKNGQIPDSFILNHLNPGVKTIMPPLN